MLWPPTLKLFVLHVALLLSPPPASAAAPAHPAIAFPSLLKLTPPVGSSPVTVAVNVTLAPAATGLPELTSVVVVDGNEGPATPRLRAR